MTSPLPPSRKADLLAALAARQDFAAVCREEGITPQGLAEILREAGRCLRSGSAPRRVQIWIDGASRNNPGPSGAGVVIEDEEGHTLAEEAAYLGQGTNNEAEYRALLLALDKARELGATALAIRSDSELLVKQVRGVYRVREPRLQELHRKAGALLGSFTDVRIDHVPRAGNRRADALANQALDEYIRTGQGKG